LPSPDERREAAIEAAARELQHDRDTNPHVLDPEREVSIVIAAYKREYELYTRDGLRSLAQTCRVAASHGGPLLSADIILRLEAWATKLDELCP